MKYVFILLIAVLGIVNGAYQDHLRFNSKGEFTILQFTDLHFGEGQYKDDNSMKLQEKLIILAKPDLVVITGDSVSGYAWDGSDRTFTQKCWNNWTQAMEKLNVPYAYTFGNHDDQANINRQQIVELDMQNKMSLTKFNGEVTGATNYVVNILSEKNDNVAASLWMLDSNDENCDGLYNSWGCIEEDEIKWYEKETAKLTEDLGYTPNGFAFFHIPIPEYRDMYNWNQTYNARNEGVNCPKKNTGFFKSLKTLGNIKAMFCGHDHNNDYGGFFEDVELVYGRKSGYGGYGPDWFQRGARIIKLKETVNSKTGKPDFEYTHYVLQEDLTIQQNTEPIWKGWLDFVDECTRQ